MVYTILVGWAAVSAAIVAALIVVPVTVRLLVGKNDRDVDRPAQWMHRLAVVINVFSHGWIIGAGFVVALMVGWWFELNPWTTRDAVLAAIKAVGACLALELSAIVLWHGVWSVHKARVDMVVAGYEQRN